MKTVLLASVLLSAAPVAAHAQSSNQAQSAEELTRLLNGGPPAATRPAAPVPTPAPAAAAPIRPAAAPRSTPIQAAPARATTAPATVAPSRAPSAATPVITARTPDPRPVPAQAPAPARAAPPLAPGVLGAAEVAALPFRIELPSGFQLFEGRGAPDARVYSVRRAGKTFAMIYTGSASQFPIYDGEQVTAAGRVSVIVSEGTRRIAMEHLFQQPTAPNEIHVWLMSLSGADRDAAERIAQSVDPK